MSYFTSLVILSPCFYALEALIWPTAALTMITGCTGVFYVLFVKTRGFEEKWAKPH